MSNIKLAAENAIIVYFDEEVTPQLSQKVASICRALEAQISGLILDLIPSYNSLFISYRLDLIDYQHFVECVSHILNQPLDTATLEQDLLTIPVYYSPETGLDLERLISDKQLTLSEFIELHSKPEYSVFAIGFSPAFAFLGHVDPLIQTPRLSTPRLEVPAGSVGIADNQTAVYPINSAGGWNIVGRTPLDLSVHNPAAVNLFSVGQRIKFEPIDRQQFIKLGGVL